jgi:hypothetical protein
MIYRGGGLTIDSAEKFRMKSDLRGCVGCWMVEFSSHGSNIPQEHAYHSPFRMMCKGAVSIRPSKRVQKCAWMAYLWYTRAES